MKNILVCGAGRGIGLEICKILAKSNKVLALSRNIEQLEQLPKDDFNLQSASLDLTSPKLSKDLTQLIEKHLNASIDVVIYNAGFLINKSFIALSSSEILSMYQTNVLGAFEVAKTAKPFLNENAHMVLISSMGGVQGTSKFPGLSAYSSSKAALIGLGECLAEEWKDDKIAVNMLALGAVQTEMLEEAFPGYQAPTTAQEMGKYIAEFSLNGNQYFSGKTLQVANSTP